MDPAAAHLLVVDDSPSVLKWISGLLIKKGYRITCAPSGESAIKLFQTDTFDMVMTDIILPGMSGLNLLKLLKESKPEIDVIIISSNSSSFTAIKALRLGAYDYIIKPLDEEAILYNVVERTLEKRALALENRKLINDLSDKNRALQESLEMMRTVNRICTLISSTLDIGDILRMLVESAVSQLQARTGYLLLLDKTGTGFSMKVCVGIDHIVARTFALRHDQGISGLTVASNKPLRLGASVPPPLLQRIKEEDADGELFSPPGIISVPLRVNEKVVGAVTISGRENNKPFSDAEVEFLATLANHAAIALGTAGTYYKLKKSV